MGNSGKIALCGIITSLSTMVMLLTTLFPFGTYALPVMAGALYVIIVIELGQKWAWCAFFSTSILSLLFAGDKEAALIFILFFGYYPIIKSNIEKLRNKPIQLVIKLLIFNITIILEFYISIYILGVPIESLYIFGFNAAWAFLIAGNIIFVMYDLCVSILISKYVYVLQKSVRRIMGLK